MDFIDGKYEFARQDLRLPNGKVEKAGSQNATFMLSNRNLGEGEIDFPRLMGNLKRVQYKGWIIVDDHYTPPGPRQDFSTAEVHPGKAAADLFVRSTARLTTPAKPRIIRCY